MDIAAPVRAGYVGDWNDDVHVGRIIAMWTSPLNVDVDAFAVEGIGHGSHEQAERHRIAGGRHVWIVDDGEEGAEAGPRCSPDR